MNCKFCGIEMVKRDDPRWEHPKWICPKCQAYYINGEWITVEKVWGEKG